MIQVLGLRDYTHNGVTKKREVFFNKGWRFNKVQDVFNPGTLNELLGRIPAADSFNLYFTVADCYEESGRKLKEQWAIPFDIDHLNLKEGEEHQAAEAAARCATEALGVDYDKVPVVFTGNGVQFFVLLEHPIIDDEYFTRTKDAYAVLAKKIQLLLIERGIKGEVDTSVWSKGRLMRLPGTFNRKPNKPERLAHLIKEGGVPIDYDIIDRSGIKEVQEPEAMSDVIIKNYPKPDTAAICEGCKFLVWCKSKPNEVKEPQWYAMASITARLDNGSELTHEYSAGHSGYSHYETELKIDQALRAAGPRTCKDIENRWEGCNTCDYYGKVTSPIMIKGPDYIASRDFGFRERKEKDGRIITGRPVYTDLIKEFTNLHPYKVVKEGNKVVVFNGKHWEPVHDLELRAWMTTIVRPEPMSTEMREFIEQLKAYNITDAKEMYEQREGLMNFQNCVLNMFTGETKPHAPEFGFFDVRPYAYDPRAKSELWESFLLDIMDNDEDMVAVLKEFGGYCISGDNMWLHKALLAVGDGSNGKSVFMETLGKVVGEDNRSAISMQELRKDTMRYQLVNRLFNYSEETSVRALADSEMFKSLVGGGVMSIKELYSQPYQIENKAKIIIAANNMPVSTDLSKGFLRRLAIVHFTKTYEPGIEGYDPHLKYKLWEQLPGICNSLIEAYKNLKARGVLPGEEKLNKNLRAYQEDTDTVLMFCKEVVVATPGTVTKVSEVYDEYRRMCEMGELEPVNVIVFGRMMAKHLALKSQVKRVNNEAYRVYDGIKLNKGY